MREDRKKSLTGLLAELGFADNIDLELVHEALIHPSYTYDNSDSSQNHNQRLEFLGDAVVGLAVAKFLFEKYPHKPEGELTKLRAAIVCEASLAYGAKSIRLGDYLLLGKGEETTGGASRHSNLADCFEAFIAALYLPLGLDKVQEFILRTLKPKIDDALSGKLGDYKTMLQEHIQRSPDNELGYKIIQEEGPDHKKMFVAAVFLNAEEIAQGSGYTKKAAEQQAARSAFNKLRQKNG